MENLNKFDYNGTAVIDSKEIAKFLNVKHENVMRTVRRIADGLSGQEVTDRFIFIMNENRISGVYMTQKGCELFADVRSRGSRTNKVMNEKFMSVCTELFQEKKPQIQTAVQDSPTATVTAPENTKEINIMDNAICIKEYKGQRVVTFKDIDAVHQRPEGTASRNFRVNRSYFIEGEDYFIVNQPDEIRRLGFTRPQGGIPESVIFLTESGYLMTVKSLRDDLAWKVQRELVKSYFRVQQIQKQTDSYMIEDPIERAKQWIKEQEERIALSAKVEEQQQQIQELAPKAEYCDKVLNSNGLVSTTEIAKMFGKSAVWLNRFLREKGVQYKIGNVWYLYQKYAECGYAVTKTTVQPDFYGRERSFTHTYWTQKGKMFVYGLLKEVHIFPVSEQQQLLLMPVEQ